MYYVILTGHSKDRPHPLIVRKSGKDAAHYLVTTYGAFQTEFHTLSVISRMQIYGQCIQFQRKSQSNTSSCYVIPNSAVLVI